MLDVAILCGRCGGDGANTDAAAVRRGRCLIRKGRRMPPANAAFALRAPAAKTAESVADAVAFERAKDAAAQPEAGAVSGYE
jgi:hypothetical protein